MNPKSMHRERLLGHMDIDTREWADGVLTDAARYLYDSVVEYGILYYWYLLAVSVL